MRRSLLLVTVVALAACHGSSTDSPDAGNACATETRADTFVVGLEKQGSKGNFAFKLMSSTPAPPSRGNNTWIVEVDALSAGIAGAPISGAVMSAVPFMPDHGHGSALAVNITTTATPGQYQLDPVNLWMPGYWETTVTASQGGMTDAAIFKFCIPN